MNPSWDFARLDSCSVADKVVPRVVVGDMGCVREMFRSYIRSSCAEISCCKTNVQSVEIFSGRAYRQYCLESGVRG